MSAPDDFEPDELGGEPDDDPAPMTDAEMAELEASLPPMTDAEAAAALEAGPDWDAAAEAALALVDFELSDEQCMKVAALLQPYAEVHG